MPMIAILVAILTGPGQSVLPNDDAELVYHPKLLRSSPALGVGAASELWRVQARGVRVAILTGLDGSVLHQRQQDDQGAHAVASLTGLGGPVLRGGPNSGQETARTVAILTALAGRCCRADAHERCRRGTGCDPHRPWRAGAAAREQDKQGWRMELSGDLLVPWDDTLD
jgi:hypothetical protein